MTPLAWCIVLLVVGMALIFLEMFIPSAGVLSFAAAMAILAAVVMAYMNYGAVTGTIFLGVGVVLVPAAIVMALRWYPHTPLGRMIMATPPAPDELQPQDKALREIMQLKGKIGQAKTPLLPSGAVKIDGRTYDAVCVGEIADAGDPVVVVRTEGSHVVVRKTSGEPSPEPKKGDDVLSQPIESLGIDPLDDPLG